MILLVFILSTLYIFYINSVCGIGTSKTPFIAEMSILPTSACMIGRSDITGEISLVISHHEKASITVAGEFPMPVIRSAAQY